MRADRLVALLLALQRRGRLTAAQVAEELEVSVPTARRDLDALAAAGIPVYAQPGRGGGWQLLGGGRTDLSGLTADEARALFAVAGPSSAVTPAVRTALRKLVQALPPPFRADAEAASEAVVIDADGWGAETTTPPPHLEVLRTAVIRRRQVRIRYAPGEASRSRTRVAHPLGIVTKGGHWYLMADTASGRRTFRVDRVTAAEMLDEPARRPDDLHLAEAWASIAVDVDRRRTRQLAHVAASTDAVGGLRVQFGTDLAVGEGRPDGRVSVRIGGATTDQLAERLAGWADEIEVLEPAELRHRLAAIGAALVRAYSTR